jgi:hypothetical protein
MTRMLTVTSVVLIVLCLFQWHMLRELKTELAAVDARARQAALVDLHDRRDEVLRVMTWIDVTRRAASGGGPIAGLCTDDALDTDRVGRWLFDTYLLERAKGNTEIDARQRLLEVIRSSSR